MRNPASLFPRDEDLALMTDLYELTMAAGYFASGHNPRVAFEAFVRVLPTNRCFLIAAGLEQALHYLLNLRFTDENIDWLASLEQFKKVPREFFDYLRQLRFTGDVWAIPEGTVVFAGEPLLRIEADLIQAQLAETYLLTCLNLQTLVATKAARITMAAAGRPVVDFGARRAHGPQAGLLAARAAIIGGCAGTSNVLAAKILGVPAVGTQAHSWVMSFTSEHEAFKTYAELFPEHAICLIDTYDSIKGARIAAETLGANLKGVRLDSGNIADLARRVRQVLDEAGCQQAKIVASGDLNEYIIADLVRQDVPIDFFGVGTDLVTSKDAPALSVVYKLVAVQEQTGNWKPVTKKSQNKATLGGRKQVWRQYERDGKFSRDFIGLADEQHDGQPLLQKYVEAGKPVADLPTVQQIAEHARRQLRALPEAAKSLRGNFDYPVLLTDALKAAQP